MTAFDNIKVNNWPATFNDFEDFLVLKMPLNDQTSLTESLPIIAGSQELLSKKTFTNTSTTSLESGTVYSTEGTQTGSDWGAGHEITGAFRKGALLYTASGEGAFAAGNTSLRYTFPSPITVTDNVKIYFWRNGGNIKVNAGETDEQTDSTSSGYTTWTIPASTVGVLRNVELYTHVNTGPYWSGIEVDGVQLYDAPGGAKKHYDNNAVFTTSHLATPAHSDLALDGDQWTVEFWIKPDSGMSNEACPVRAGTNYSTDRSPYLGYLSGTNWQLYMSSGTGGSWDIAGGNNFGTLTVGTWKHYAIVRNGSSFKAYENGTETLSLTRNVGAVYQATNSWSIGKAFTSSGYFKGAIQDLRFYKGVAKYTANFTPPSAILG